MRVGRIAAQPPSIRLCLAGTSAAWPASVSLGGGTGSNGVLRSPPIAPAYVHYISMYYVSTLCSQIKCLLPSPDGLLSGPCDLPLPPSSCFTNHSPRYSLLLPREKDNVFTPKCSDLCARPDGQRSRYAGASCDGAVLQGERHTSATVLALQSRKQGQLLLQLGRLLHVQRAVLGWKLYQQFIECPGLY